VKLVHLVGFIIKKCVMMYGHTNVRKTPIRLHGVVLYFNCILPLTTAITSDVIEATHLTKRH